ncbi:hypothetical protein [Metabacillus sp. FJAT-52054]|uniref:6-bladed beta-propeller n=1 Tax=Metabacillus sediminis TaxID=3117746 RepID=A0ABZ2NIG2_9BACI
MNSIKARLLYNVKDYVKDCDDFTFCVDYHGNPILLLEKKVNGKFKHEVFHFTSDNSVININFPEVKDFFSYVQPIEDKWLFVCGSDEIYENNASVYDSDGKLLYTFKIGNGIQDVQTTIDSKIWVSYYEQSDGDELNCFDIYGNLTFDFVEFVQENNRIIPFITDCYALNVTSKNINVYYYTEFPLVSIYESGEYKLYEELGIRGSNGFAINDNFVLFNHDYEKKPEVSLYSLSNKEIKKFQTIDENGKILEYDHSKGREDILYLVKDSEIFIIDLSELEINNNK